ncbi:glycosyltransferase [Flavobacterium sp. AG291]|uniref:glycosyltransferase family protein n=1 Tax=Flavobacterium sp. AG291 TaxID=2184000 RepID=UPI000E0BF271|nr:glycosyltransferase [Flavobacterium sp. AG291]RDI05827.1 glycosyltransferase involved in cell wall biosynthesis [Flavobacterium sp. AG291]
MKILLLGEYSRFHNSLKEGLVKLGHEVTLVSDNDFKNYPADIFLYSTIFKDNYILNKIRQGIFRILKLDIAHLEIAFRFYRKRKQFKGFDVVQLINEYPLPSTLYLEAKILKYIFKNNKKTFLSSSGDDYICVNYMLEGKFRYSVLTPCETYPDARHCQYTLFYATKSFKKLHDFVFQNIQAVIAGDMDYSIPLEGHPKFAGLIPYPINTEKLQVIDVASPVTSKIVIFHGINNVNYYKKGNYLFEKALEVISEKYNDRVEIITTRSVPYSTYVTLYNKCHILLDQAFSYDQGYNALEAMAQGKVVFTGAEKEFMQHYNLTERVAINALPDVNALVNDLSYLIENPEEIIAISKRARAFIEKEHEHIKVAQKYLEKWNR